MLKDIVNLVIYGLTSALKADSQTQILNKVFKC